ncbi:MAG: tRNA 2-thiouridine(34) synthase MnmA [Chloroflexi bacterium]|nr:tRNA 2-thiouridine(34) synthase MnmA [Chloroflexota bacterium]
MSGGVDSSVAAALLKQQGYQVVGIMLRLWSEVQPGVGSANRCCTPDAVDDARRVADRLEIPFYLVNVEEPFRRHVVEPFIQGYSQGRTPNPCIECNRHIRFRLLLQRALALGAQALATGHYARVVAQGARFRLLRGVDRAKDQSYQLHMLGQEELAHLLLPLGDLTKGEVRALARRHGLPVAEKPESQEICFVADDDYRRFLRHWAPESFRPGPIVDRRGRVLGQHSGLPAYTVGQRKGLGIAAAEPLYVLELDAPGNRVVVGTAGELGARRLWAQGVSYVCGSAPAAPRRVTAKIRHQAEEAPVLLEPGASATACLTFDQPLRDITPGQAVVFYDGEEVLGGGAIVRAAA